MYKYYVFKLTFDGARGEFARDGETLCEIGTVRFRLVALRAARAADAAVCRGIKRGVATSVFKYSYHSLTLLYA